MVTENTEELLTKLDDGLIDFAVIEGFFEKSKYDYLPFLTESYIPVCAPGYSFHKPVHILEISGEKTASLPRIIKAFTRYLKAIPPKTDSDLRHCLLTGFIQ